MISPSTFESGSKQVQMTTVKKHSPLSIKSDKHEAEGDNFPVLSHFLLRGCSELEKGCCSLDNPLQWLWARGLGLNPALPPTWLQAGPWDFQCLYDRPCRIAVVLRNAFKCCSVSCSGASQGCRTKMHKTGSIKQQTFILFYQAVREALASLRLWAWAFLCLSSLWEKQSLQSPPPLTYNVLLACLWLCIQIWPLGQQSRHIRGANSAHGIYVNLGNLLSKWGHVLRS